MRSQVGYAYQVRHGLTTEVRKYRSAVVLKYSTANNEECTPRCCGSKPWRLCR